MKPETLECVHGLDGARMDGPWQALMAESWSAENIGDEPLAKGDRATVERLDGLLLFVRGNRS